MEVNNSATVRFFLAWCLLATTVIALTGCRGARAALEAGNATIPRRCHDSECLIAYQQPEVELMGVLDPEHALGSIRPGEISNGAVMNQDIGGCGRPMRGERYTQCPPKRNTSPTRDVYFRGSRED